MKKSKKSNWHILEYWSVLLGGCGILLMLGSLFITIRSCMRPSPLDISLEDKAKKIEIPKIQSAYCQIVYSKLKYGMSEEEVYEVMGPKYGWKLTEWKSGGKQWMRHGDTKKPEALYLHIYKNKLITFAYLDGEITKVSGPAGEHIYDDNEKEEEPMVTKF